MEKSVAVLELDKKRLGSRLLASVVEERFLYSLGKDWEGFKMDDAHHAYLRYLNRNYHRSAYTMTKAEAKRYEAVLRKLFPGYNVITQSQTLESDIRWATAFVMAHDENTTVDELLAAIDAVPEDKAQKVSYRAMARAAADLKPRAFKLMQLMTREDWKNA